MKSGIPLMRTNTSHRVLLLASWQIQVNHRNRDDEYKLGTTERAPSLQLTQKGPFRAVGSVITKGKKHVPHLY
jgi:hypothetical protein